MGGWVGGWVGASRRRASVQIQVGSGSGGAGGRRMERRSPYHHNVPGGGAMPSPRCTSHSPEGILPKEWRLAVHGGGGGCRSGGGQTSLPQVVLHHFHALARLCGGGCGCRSQWLQLTRWAALCGALLCAACALLLVGWQHVNAKTVQTRAMHLLKLQSCNAGVPLAFDSTPRQS